MGWAAHTAAASWRISCQARASRVSPMARHSWVPSCKAAATKGCTRRAMASTTASGRRTCEMGTACFATRAAPNTRVAGRLGKSTARASTRLTPETSFGGTSPITNSTATACSPLWTAECTRAAGSADSAAAGDSSSTRMGTTSAESGRRTGAHTAACSSGTGRCSRVSTTSWGGRARASTRICLATATMAPSSAGRGVVLVSSRCTPSLDGI
mmetsp:Transcript_15986/g.26799  ORF Transcript_15986/g.26799 Transcript_15986/m.26799 type:complete len:213 (-) Transcript_15986:1335-1973(-)